MPAPHPKGRSSPQAELEARRDRVARLEQERADLQIEIDAFQRAYLARLAAAQSDLEALELSLAEYRLRNELLRLRGSALDAHKLEAEVAWQLRGRRQQFAAPPTDEAVPMCWWDGDYLGYQESAPHLREGAARAPSGASKASSENNLTISCASKHAARWCNSNSEKGDAASS